MNKIIIPILVILIVLLNSCEEDIDTFYTCLEDIEYSDYEMKFHKIIGYDDFGSSGAALVVAIDTVEHAALITALKFELPLSHKNFIPNCNPIETTAGYNWGKINSITSSISREYPYISNFLTNTAGIRNMSEEISAYLVIENTAESDLEEDIEEPTTKYFVAIDGEVELTRLDDPSDILEGELNFIEMDTPGTEAVIAEGALYYSVDDIYIEWDTGNQPD